jgi:MFS family permease
MLPLSLFRSRNFSGANLLTLFLYAGLSGTLFFYPLNLIQVQGYSATIAGASFLPFPILMFVLSRWSGGLVKRYGAKIPLIIGPLIASVGFGLFLIPTIGGSYWTTFFPAIVVLGLGMAISVAPLTTTVMNSVNADRAGIASGINNAVARTAGLLAIAVFGIIMLQVFNHDLDQRLATTSVPQFARTAIDHERVKLAGIPIPSGLNAEMQRKIEIAIKWAFISGFRVTMLVGAGLAVASALTSLLMIQTREKPG